MTYRSRSFRWCGRRVGFVTFDILLGFSLVAAMLAMLVMSGAQAQRADRVFAERREVIRAIELRALGGDAGVEGLTSEVLDAEAPAGHAWVRWQGQAGGRVESLVVLTPLERLP
ncbi:MAG: hypothetical protein AAF823_00495 [Planctomycetota bacterium]